MIFFIYFRFLLFALFGLSIAVFVSACSTADPVPEPSSILGAGQTLEFLLMSEGEPTEVIHGSIDGEHFDSYYYRISNTTYIINTETDYVCSEAFGKHVGSCSPELE